MKPELVILSDLWGGLDSLWVHAYQSALQNHFTIDYIDCALLADISPEDRDMNSRHQQFVSGGIDRAVQRLQDTTSTKRTTIIGCSVGGVIGWKYALEVSTVDQLICISSTRLRLEASCPATTVSLIFGEKDPYKPNKQWFERMNTPNIQILERQGHDCYKEPEGLEAIIQQLLS